MGCVSSIFLLWNTDSKKKTLKCSREKLSSVSVLNQYCYTHIFFKKKIVMFVWLFYFIFVFVIVSQCKCVMCMSVYFLRTI